MEEFKRQIKILLLYKQDIIDTMKMVILKENNLSLRMMYDKNDWRRSWRLDSRI